jgi:hypothetical protein
MQVHSAVSEFLHDDRGADMAEIICVIIKISELAQRRKS